MQRPVFSKPVDWKIRPPAFAASLRLNPNNLFFKASPRGFEGMPGEGSKPHGVFPWIGEEEQGRRRNFVHDRRRARVSGIKWRK